MQNKEYMRKQKEDRPVVAICYDFDKTLSPDDMQAQGFIQSVGYDVAEFWQESNSLAGNNDMDQNLAYMFKMMDAAEGRVLFTRETLLKCGAQVRLFPGVEDWFQRIREYGEANGVIVEHYIISSGLKEMIEGTAIAGEFEKIYASAFFYNDKNVAKWPAQVVNYTNKTQFLFRIEKGVLDINDPGVNEAFAPEDIRVPFRNMIYIGDSDTDIPCMKLVNSYGGHSIGVYNTDTLDKTKVYKMMREGRIKYYAPADYSEGAQLDELVKAIIDRTATNERLEELHFQCKKENIEADKQNSEEELAKTSLLISLENSRSFARTHEMIEKLSQYSTWSPEEEELLFRIAVTNSQVKYIINDSDVKLFYSRILRNAKRLTENAKTVKEMMEREE
jgi:2-hydroxy-3-keto-5-methylthiopentenyl-1-phosphate phosphatase